MDKKLIVVKKKVNLKKVRPNSTWRSYDDMVARQDLLCGIDNSMRIVFNEITDARRSIDELPKTFDNSKRELIKISQQLDASIINASTQNIKLKQAIECSDIFTKEYRETLSLIRKMLNKINKGVGEMANLIKEGDEK
jgi:hypothetical protein|tara:strand:+ start:231 stop:644 length:414 start_codon:yes stop_codon:yes gene_type:complete